MKRIHWHWTAGRHQPNDAEMNAYHRLITGDGRIIHGAHTIAANVPPLRRNEYAAHTLNANSYAIGVAVCAMFGAQERPFKTGKYPITAEQIEQLVYLSAKLGRDYNIPASPSHMLTHAEVQANLGIRQRAKWDIIWLPGMDAPTNPRIVGDELRNRVAAAMMPRKWWWFWK
jgi:hypothetical protein